MPLKDFVPERVYRTLARFAGYGLLALAVAAPFYLMDSRYSARLERQMEVFEQRLQESREQDMGKIRDFLDRYVGVVEGMGKEIKELQEGHKDTRECTLRLSGDSLIHQMCIQDLQDKTGFKNNYLIKK